MESKVWAKSLFLIIVLSISTLLVSQRKYKYLNQKIQFDSLQIPGTIKSIQIVDKRENVVEEDIKIPFFTFPGKPKLINPAITKSQDSMIREEVYRYFNNDKQNIYSIQINILEASKGFRATSFSEIELIAYKIYVDLFDESKGQKMQCSSEFNFDLSSGDASNKFLNYAYNLGLLKAINYCFSKFQTK